jgi:hypothetical protein
MNDDVIAQLESQKREFENWLNNPITKLLKEDNATEQEKLVRVITQGDFEDMKTYFSATGHLRGLRRAFGVVEDELDSINHQLKELK